ncbi:ABC transporter substrate-binding protein [Pseudofrankia sp. DC12]|uniref:ABC transporter substrate-binding protein n=1 Tax=Pseudofrankia sp. DC12 TaxID=683315 RepID=UPI0005F833BD|nr:ABC transporter substrate-binding protein [Pseudofrankia sp. DC12]
MNRIWRARRAALPAASAALLGAVIAGCGGSAATSAGGSPVKGGTIVYGHEQEPPCLAGGWVQQAYLDRNILDSIVTEADDGSIKPWLADSWTISADRLTYTFTLKPGVKFTDGTPLDAQAIADNFAYWEKGGNSTAQVSIDPYFKSATAIDATHLAVTLNKPYLPLLTMLSQAYFGIQSPTALKRGDAVNCDDPIGSGAFKVKEWKHGQEVILVKNPNYTSWPATAKHKGPAIVDEVDWKFLPDPVQRYAALTTGEANVIYDVPTVNWKAAQAQFGVQQYITPGKPVSVYLNTSRGVFTDKLVRQAFAYGADRKSAVQAGFHGVIPYEGNPSVSQATPGYDAETATQYAYDPAKAGQLLDQAGWTQRNGQGYRTKDGKELDVTFAYPAGSVFTSEGATVLQDLQQEWKQVGFNVKLVPETQAETFAGKFSKPDSYDAQPWYWTSPSPAILWIVWRPSTADNPNYNNSSFYNNDQLSTVIQQGNSAPDTSTANGYYAQAQGIIQDNAAAVGLYTQTTSIAAAKNLRDVWLEKSQGEPVFEDAYFTK